MLLAVGIIFNKDSETYILTAAHVVSSSFSIIIVDNTLYNQRYIIKQWKDLSILQPDTLRRTKAKILAIDTKIDVAILKTDNFIPVSKNMLIDTSVPKVASAIYMVGNIKGAAFPNSISYGRTGPYFKVLSNSSILDQSNLPIVLGCSGGGVYLQSSGKLIGIVSRGLYGDQTNFTLYVPTRIIFDWAKLNNVDFVFNNKPLQKMRLKDVEMLMITEIPRPTTSPTTKATSEEDVFKKLNK